MSDERDVVERLREGAAADEDAAQAAAFSDDAEAVGHILAAAEMQREAADTITTLRAEVLRLRGEVERLREALEVIASIDNAPTNWRAPQPGDIHKHAGRVTLMREIAFAATDGGGK